MGGWERIRLVAPSGMLRAPGEIAAALKATGGTTPLLFVGHTLDTVPSYARLLCHHVGALGRPWAAEATLAVASDPSLLRLLRRSRCRALVLGPDPDLLGREEGRAPEPAALRAAVTALRAIRRAGLLTAAHVEVGRPGDDAGIFGVAVRFFLQARVAFPHFEAHSGGDLDPEDVARGLAWAMWALHGRIAMLRRSALAPSVLVANGRIRRTLAAAPAPTLTPVVRLARALARPIRIRERVPFVSTLANAVQATGDQVRTAWLRARAVRDSARTALVIRLEGSVDARAARKLVTRVRRALGRRPVRIVIDVGGVEHVSLTVLTRFLEEHASRLVALRCHLAFRNLGPTLAALRANLHGMLPNASLLEQTLEETP